jgi:hypothetical protein
MSVLRRAGLAVTFLLIAVPLGPTVVRGQPGFYLTPSLSISEVYDDNILFTPSRRERDFITRLTPDIQIGYQSIPLTLLGRYTFDAEEFAEHSNLSTAQARQQASLETRYLLTPRLTLGLDGTYLETQSAAELNVQTGVGTTRVRAERILLHPFLDYQLDRLTRGLLEYTFVRDDLPANNLVTDTHVVNLGLDRRVTELDTASLAYTVQRFDFHGAGTPETGPPQAGTVTSHTATIGWKRQLTSRTDVTLRAGPRFSDGSVDAEALASIHHAWPRGDLSLTYARTQSTVIGQVGTVNTHSVTGALVYRFLPTLQLRIAPGYFMNTRGAAESDVYRVDLDVSYQLTRLLSLTASYQFARQEGTDFPIGGAAQSNVTITHNVFLLRLTAAYPYRLN